MSTRLIAAAALVLSVAAPLAAASPAAAAEPCTPSISMGKPFQDGKGFVTFPATYSVCDATMVKIKIRDRDQVPVSWGGGGGTAPAGSSATTYSATCHPDGKAHRWVAYATLKTPQGPGGGQLIAQTAKVYFKSAPVTGNCGTWTPPTG